MANKENMSKSFCSIQTHICCRLTNNNIHEFTFREICIQKLGLGRCMLHCISVLLFILSVFVLFSASICPVMLLLSADLCGTQEVRCVCPNMDADDCDHWRNMLSAPSTGNVPPTPS